MLVEMYTDGACSGNPGPGGWGVVLRCNGKEKNISGGEEDTTNNRMELQAAIEGLRALNKPCDVILYTDSEYVKNGITQWIQQWRKKNWRNSAGKPVKNKDLWQALEEVSASYESSGYNIEWRWVKGHSGHPENDLADMLARDAIPK